MGKYDIHIKTAVIRIEDVYYLFDDTTGHTISNFVVALYSIIDEAKYERKSHADIREHSLSVVIGTCLATNMGCIKIDYSTFDKPHKLFQIEDEKVISH